MDLRLHLLESFMATGADGQQYKVCGYERLAPDQSVGDHVEHWESTGQVEYRLADGRRVDVGADGVMRVAGTDLALSPAAAGSAAVAAGAVSR